jgi:hypothetical protein
MLCRSNGASHVAYSNKGIQRRSLGAWDDSRLLQDSHSCMVECKQAFRLCGAMPFTTAYQVDRQQFLKHDCTCRHVRRRMTGWVRGRCGCTELSLCSGHRKRLPADRCLPTLQQKRNEAGQTRADRNYKPKGRTYCTGMNKEKPDGNQTRACSG